jgi:hypothetical protein
MTRPDDPTRPLGGWTDYGPTRPTGAEKRAAIIERYGLPVQLIECGCCGAFHPAEFFGDCRTDLFRVNDPDALFPDGWKEMESAE